MSPALPRILPEADLTWKLVPGGAPAVLRRCSRCDAPREFLCSEKFRINGHQSRVDVWLIYKCGVCDSTWKLTVFTRELPRKIGPDLYQRFEDNDRDTAWDYAFDAELLRRAGVEMAEIGYTIEGPPLTGEHLLRDEVRVRITFDRPPHARLLPLLADRLGISRGQVRQLFEEQALRIAPAPKQLARHRLHEEVMVTVDSPALRAALLSR